MGSNSWLNKLEAMLESKLAMVEAEQVQQQPPSPFSQRDIVHFSFEIPTAISAWAEHVEQVAALSLFPSQICEFCL